MKAGDFVTISGIEKKPELNGRPGMVVEMLENGRVGVQVLDPGTGALDPNAISLNPKNLTVIDPDELQGPKPTAGKPMKSTSEPKVPWSAVTAGLEELELGGPEFEQRYRSLGVDARTAVVEFAEVQREKIEEGKLVLKGNPEKAAKERARVLKMFDMVERQQSKAEAGMCCVM